ncbi:SecD/SecF fusion protein [Fibrobacter intestinalis]|uniref:Multifunctional fusion protein n=2 Tax=Fibrobacteraceae TaxID=204431 RepID=A0A1T4JR03_9BACT|nr:MULTISPECIES: protein translocase subunit SecD [Fibrobacter]PBC74115.1 SecD/SecF fusion protein [Fibrobacter sp. NR9]SJZ32581.1 SecD/SecF fusion protein [Fibrobacter intestinalis]
MKKKLFGMREFIILGVILLAAWSIIPSIQVHSKSGEAKKEFIKQNPKVAAKAMNFGLDLAGGTSITLQIDSKGLKTEDIKDIQQQSLEIVRNRVDQFGLSEPQISPSGNDRINVELAGVDDSTAKALVGSTAKLEFKILAEQEKFSQIVMLIDNYLLGRSDVKDSVQADSAAAEPVTTAKKDTLSDAELFAGNAKSDDLAKTDLTATAGSDSVKSSATGTALSALYLSFGNGGFVAQEQIETIKRILNDRTVQSLIPHDVVFAWGSGFEKLKDSPIKAKRLYLLKRRAEMSGEYVSDARPYRVSDGTNSGEVAVSLKFSGIGPKRFGAVTAANIGKQMAIVLDDQVISAPVIRDRIPNGEAQITGLDDMAEANRLAVVLRSGALKAPMNIIESRTIGATLGEDNIRSGFGSALIGIIITILFMIMYYRFGGLVASVGLVCNALITAAVLSAFGATLTLPGIAGMVLTVGMSIDANVIIFERIREELRAGNKARAAIAKGYERAFSAIFDSNLTTFLTALILYKIGTGSVKGFGLTLMIGIAGSMFTALTVTRAIFDLKLAKQDTNAISIGAGFAALNRAHLPITSKAKVFVSISAICVIIALAFSVFKGFNFSIDFTGGTVFRVQYNDAEDHLKDLNAVLAKFNVTDGTVRTMGATSLQNTYEVSVKSEQGADVIKAIDSDERVQILSQDEVGATIGEELRFNAILSVFLAWLAICLYVWFRFGKLGLGFGLGAVLGLVHDTVLTVGFVSLLGLSVDGAMVAAFLTMIGYSVNDTIVNYDRIRENVKLHGGSDFAKTVDASVSQSFSRTVITSLSTLFVCVILAVMGGSSIRDFGLVMTFGAIVGTYSSVFICAPFVVWFNKHVRRLV